MDARGESDGEGALLSGHNKRALGGWSLCQTFAKLVGTRTRRACRRVQEGAPVPDDAWEYRIRESLKDAAFTGLMYRPYVSTMPTPPEVDAGDAKWVWVSGARAGVGGWRALLLQRERLPKLSAPARLTRSVHAPSADEEMSGWWTEPQT